MEEPVGRILSSNLKTARVEFSREDLEEGMLLEIEIPLTPQVTKTINAKIDKLEITKHAGLTGTIYYLDRLDRPPKYMTPVRLSYDVEEGIFFVGIDTRYVDIKLQLNPLFGHVLVSGMTKAGKTHFMIVLLEEMLKHEVPCIVFDPHGEFVNLVKYAPDKVVLVEDLRIDNCIALLQQRKTIVYNLLGLAKVSKANRLSEILSALKLLKEEDYAQAENNPLLLKIPPTLIFIDEAEIFAPNQRGPSINQVRSGALPAIMDIAKEGAKFGLGLIVAPQRVTRLDIDVRGQCNSAVLFRFVDRGSRTAISLMDYITNRDLDALKGFAQGEALLTGRIVKRPRVVTIRDIKSERAKDVNFAEILGLFGGKIAQPYIVETQTTEEDAEGNIIESQTGLVIQTAKERFDDEDKIAFDQSEGDGVVLRTEPIPESVLKEIQIKSHLLETIEASGLDREETQELMEMVESTKFDTLPFETHLTDEDKELMDKLKKLNEENNL